MTLTRTGHFDFSPAACAPAGQFDAVAQPTQPQVQTPQPQVQTPAPDAMPARPGNRIAGGPLQRLQSAFRQCLGRTDAADSTHSTGSAGSVARDSRRGPAMIGPALRDAARHALVHGIRHNGDGHVCWGSKPMALLDDPPLVLMLREMARDRGLKDNFALIDVSAHRSVLVNIWNLRRLVMEHAAFFSAVIGPDTPQATIGRILSQIRDGTCRMPFSTPGSPPGRPIPGTAATPLPDLLLGHGMDNASRFAGRFRNPAHHFEPESPARQFASDIAASAPTGDRSNPWIDIPPFRTWDSAESTELIRRNLNESLDMQQVFLKDALASADPAAAIAHAFCEGIFAQPDPVADRMPSSPGAASGPARH